MENSSWHAQWPILISNKLRIIEWLNCVCHGSSNEFNLIQLLSIPNSALTSSQNPFRKKKEYLGWLKHKEID